MRDAFHIIGVTQFIDSLLYFYHKKHSNVNTILIMILTFVRLRRGIENHNKLKMLLIWLKITGEKQFWL